MTTVFTSADHLLLKHRTKQNNTSSSVRVTSAGKRLLKKNSLLFQVNILPVDILQCSGLENVFKEIISYSHILKVEILDLEN